MKGSLLTLLVVSLSTTVYAQREVTVRAQVPDCGEKLQLYTFTGFGFEPLVPLLPTEAGHYEATFTVPGPAVRYLGTDPKNAATLIVGNDDTLTLVGSCSQLKQAAVTGSAINTAYAALIDDFADYNERYTTLTQDIEVVQNERVNREGRAAMRALDEEKAARVTALQGEYPLLGRIASLNTFLSHYGNDSTAAPTDRLNHYVNTYFRFVDHDDPGYNDLPWTYEANRAYAGNLLRALPGRELGELLVTVTARWPAGSRARFLARAGALSTLLSGEHPGTLILADSVIAEYEGRYPGPIAALRNATQPLRTLSVGAEAPVFTALTPAGEELALDSLRGQYVLLDFWASWCGPCRRENPNVVRMYERFRGQGFEILGVSLDDKRDRWEGAIAADKLTWLHVSDLRGWQSAYARLYNVSSIPQTVLLDPEGRIVARNLRGADLERKLEEVLTSRR